MVAEPAGARSTGRHAEPRRHTERQPRHGRVSLHLEMKSRHPEPRRRRSMTSQVLLAATVFVTNERAGSITVIDSSTDKVVKTIAVGTRTRGMALSPDGRRLYVAVGHCRDRPARGPDEIAVVDTNSLRVTGHFKSGTDPEGVAISPDGKRLF